MCVFCEAAKPGIARLPRYTRPFCGMFSACAGVREGFISGGLLDKRRAELGSTPPVDPLMVVETVAVAPKSGLGRRLFPVMGAWDSPYPPLSTNFSKPKMCGCQAKPKRGSKSYRSMGTRYLERPPRPA